MGLTSPPIPRVPNPPARFRPSGRGEMKAVAILEALRESEAPKALTREEHNRKEAEREVEMMLCGEGALYRYTPLQENGSRNNEQRP